ncbi:MAG: CDP-alcohol phosphatidyltransferase family protein [Lachnospiraceae bacterium]|nr:CDP-alcohol phosphatidyltransferase family protein [Lachnospiraceae bacterium]
MIGFYDYSVWLTYASLLSATMGVMVCLKGVGHPFYGMFFLLFCGLCDTFDGAVARMKKDRTPMENQFGIQIDSLSDLVAFGVLPACIGIAMLRVNERLTDIPVLVVSPGTKRILYPILLTGIVLFYALAALIRLAYFNVSEEERQRTEGGKRKFYQGLPVTSSALIFPTVLMVEFILKRDLTLVYFAVMLLVGILFITPFQLRKPGKRGIAIMLGLGVIEFVVLIVIRSRMVG